MQFDSWLNENNNLVQLHQITQATKSPPDLTQATKLTLAFESSRIARTYRRAYIPPSEVHLATQNCSCYPCCCLYRFETKKFCSHWPFLG